MNFVYSLLGIGAVAAAAYYAWRQIRLARVEGTDGQASGPTMMSLRRASRDAGRTAKDTVEQVGKDVSRGAKDLAKDAKNSAQEIQYAASGATSSTKKS